MCIRDRVIIELYSNGEKVSVIARTINRSLAYVYRVVRRFESSGSVENLSRPGRPLSIDIRENRRLQNIENSDRRTPFKEFTELFNENRTYSVSWKTIKRRLKENGYLGGVYKKKMLSKTQTERNVCHGVEKKDGGMYETSGL
mgnify:CR=1 FL=1